MNSAESIYLMAEPGVMADHLRNKGDNVQPGQQCMATNTGCHTNVNLRDGD